MPPQVARIFTSVLLLFLAVFVYVIAYVAFSSIGNSLPYGDFTAVSLWSSGLITWLFVRFAWYLIWRRQVVQSRQRRRRSETVTAATLALGALIAIGSMIPNHIAPQELIALIGSTVTPLLGLIGTVWVYSETTADRATRASAAKTTEIRCPDCTYNLAGLTSTRCPECGKEYPLDALLAAQAQPAGQDV
jgi:hypothetical protein